MSTVGKWLAGIANVLGFPGLIRDSDYTSDDSRISVRVRRGLAFTVVTVNNVDIYFQRWSGRVDGVGLNANLRNRSAAAGKSARSGAAP
jgi:hypothetical protein